MSPPKTDFSPGEPSGTDEKFFNCKADERVQEDYGHLVAPAMNIFAALIVLVAAVIIYMK